VQIAALCKPGGLIESGMTEALVRNFLKNTRLMAYQVNAPAKTNIRITWLHEILFSLNIGFAVAYALFAYDGSSRIAMYGPKDARDFLEAFSQMLTRIAPLIMQMRTKGEILRSEMIREGLFIALTLSIALLLYLFVKPFARTPAGKLVFVPISGIAAVIAAPGCWLYIVHTTGRALEVDTFSGTSGYMFILETVLAGGCIYLVRNQAIWPGSLVFLLHYAFWILIAFRDGHFLAPISSSIPISLAFPCSGIAWLQYVRAVRPDEAPQGLRCGSEQKEK
jgi:hypothetical protein